jgi:hypothetical protein
VLVGKERRPDRAEQEFGDRHFAEKLEGLERQHQDDAGRHQDGSGRADKQQPFDDEFSEPSRASSHRA